MSLFAFDDEDVKKFRTGREYLHAKIAKTLEQVREAHAQMIKEKNTDEARFLAITTLYSLSGDPREPTHVRVASGVLMRTYALMAVKGCGFEEALEVTSKEEFKRIPEHLLIALDTAFAMAKTIVCGDTSAIDELLAAAGFTEIPSPDSTKH